MRAKLQVQHGFDAYIAPQSRSLQLSLTGLHGETLTLKTAADIPPQSGGTEEVTSACQAGQYQALAAKYLRVSEQSGKCDWTEGLAHLSEK